MAGNVKSAVTNVRKNKQRQSEEQRTRKPMVSMKQLDAIDRTVTSKPMVSMKQMKAVDGLMRGGSAASAAAKSAAAPFRKTSVEPRRVVGRPNYVEKQTVNRNALNGSASDSARKSIEAAFRKKR